MAFCVLALLIPLVLLTLQWRRGRGGFADLADTRRQLAAEFASSLTGYPLRALKKAKRSADAEIHRWNRLRSALPITTALVAISTALLGTAAVSEAEWLGVVRKAAPACGLSVAIALLLPLGFLERLHRVSEALDEAISCLEEEAEASRPSGWLAGASRGLLQLLR